MCCEENRNNKVFGMCAEQNYFIIKFLMNFQVGSKLTESIRLLVDIS